MKCTHGHMEYGIAAIGPRGSGAAPNQTTGLAKMQKNSSVMDGEPFLIGLAIIPRLSRLAQ